MSFFNFRNQNKFQDIAKILSHNEQTSKMSLHEKHPHTRDIFARHNIDLKELRRKGVKAATAATVLGAFLAFPHLLGNAPTETKHEPNLKTLSIEKQIEKPDGALSHKNQQTSTSNTNMHHNLAANSPSQVNDRAGDDKKSQGHIHGRSYLAPPKEHGFHDLGLHRGEDQDNGKAESPGPHPEDLGINHPENQL